jgi:type II secretory ATPase GspE/PulE/Tfp pilus assembly ATPase PilB-like protein
VECKKEKVLTEKEITIIKNIANTSKLNGKDFINFGVDMNAPFKLYDAVGCEKCNRTGYKGRMGIFEAIQKDAEIEKVIIENPSEREIKLIAAKQRSLSMREDGIIKVIKGITSMEEVASVVDLLEP